MVSQMADPHSIEATSEDEAHVMAWLVEVTGAKEISLGSLYALCSELGKEEEMASIGRVALKHGITEIASFMFQQLQWSDAQLITAIRALELGQYQLAFKIFRDRKDADNLRTLVPLAIKANDFGPAYEALKFLGDKEGLRELGTASLSGGNYIVAELAFEAAGDLKGLHSIAKAAAASGDFKIGLELLRKELKRVEDARSRILRDFSEAGVAAMERKNLPAALKAFEAAKDKKHALELGNIAMRIKNFKLAVNAFSIAGDNAAVKTAQEQLEEYYERKNGQDP